MTEIKNFEHNPMLKEMLINYCSRIYKKNMILDEHLIDEYFILVKNNELNLLFEVEYMINFLKNGDDRG